MELTARPDFDTALEVLTDVQRRRLLTALLEHNPQEDSVRVPEDVSIGEEGLESVQVEMFHTHLPKLEEFGFIQWNRDESEVVKGPRFDEIQPLLELIHTHRDELPDGWV